MPKVPTNGTQLHYEVHGEGAPLLLIHGLGSSIRDWEFQIPEFSRFYQVIAIDLRGHGESDRPPGPYDIPMFAADIAGLLKALQITSSHVLGISLGGAVAFQLAIDAPGTVRTLTVVNSNPEYIARLLTQRVMLWQRLFLSHVLSMRKLGEVLTKRLLIKPEHAQLRRKLVERWTKNDKRSYLAALHALIGWSVMPKLPAIKCPTLVVAAEHDYLPVSQKENYTRLIPDARLVVIADSRHALPVEKPDEFNRTVLNFLAGFPCV